ncbi:MAG: SAM-dependent chlorinase/fluorinase [Chloroflexota bacterium]
MSGIITLTTDFGLADGYVASMKSVIFVSRPFPPVYPQG